jgi:hypothetical protein
MATLSNPTLEIDALTGETYRVTAKVNVQFTPTELYWMNPSRGRGVVSVELKSNLWGYDGGDFLLGGDDNLFSFPTRKMTKSATYTFSAVVARSVLNEDSFLFNPDEIYNKFSLVSNNTTKVPYRARNSPIIEGDFG